MKFYKDTPGLDQLDENDWEVLQTLLKILQVWVFFLLLLYTNLFIRHPSTISKLSLLRRHLHSVVVTFGLHPITQIHQTASFTFFPSPPSKPMYDTIWFGSYVRCDLTWFSCTISILEPHILRYIVLGELRSPST